MSNPLKTCLLAACLAAAASTATAAAGYAAPGAMNAGAYKAPAPKKLPTYGEAISDKLGVGLANIALSPLELHKNIVNTINEGNLALGITAGVLKGVLHMSGRIIAGFTDTLSFPLPTVPLTAPKYVWEDYNVETHYTTPLLKMQPLQ